MKLIDTTHPVDVSSNRPWSSQQIDIFRWFAHSVVPGPNGEAIEAKNLVARARAGTGKTTTIIEGVRYAPESRILLAAFNKRIAEELNARLSKSNPNATAKTLHGLGFSYVGRYWNRIPVERTSGERADGLTSKVCEIKPTDEVKVTVPDAVKRLISKLHTKAREMAPHARNAGELLDIAIQFECEPPAEWVESGFNLAFVEAKALAAMELAATVRPMAIDFADMIYLPLRNGWVRPQFDLVVIDEAQDMTTAQLELATKSCHGRIAIVGDDRQAIYGFRGADSGSLDRLKGELHAAELGLTITYRCAQSIVALASEMVPDFRAAETNPEGVIETMMREKLTGAANNGDFILSRANAPLVSVAMSLLRSGKRARIAGRDIGAGLKSLIGKLAKGNAATSVPQFLARVSVWQDKEVARLEAQKNGNAAKNTALDSKMEMVADQADMLRELSEGAVSVNEVRAKIDSLFTDDGLGAAGIITCSSVHKAKGLEADRVFLLKKTLRRTTQEEVNITYVAITRAKTHLVWVLEPQSDAKEETGL